MRQGDFDAAGLANFQVRVVDAHSHRQETFRKTWQAKRALNPKGLDFLIAMTIVLKEIVLQGGGPQKSDENCACS